MSRILLFLTLLAACTSSLADTLKLSGSISDYPIEMEIVSANWTKGTFQGRYRYVSKVSYLAISGKVKGDYVEMTETYRDEQAGRFYLKRSQDSLIGIWTNRSKAISVSLLMGKKGKNMLDAKTLTDYSGVASSSISGSYGIEEYFWNDIWFTEQQADMEIGFNGGYALVQEIDEKTIKFQVEVVVGPTYHLAFAAGEAKKKGNKYVYEEWLADKPCRVEITFSDMSVHMEANDSFECGFGARASLGHSFQKIGDQVEFKMDQSLEQIKEKL
jgi:hypothetical protein